MSIPDHKLIPGTGLIVDGFKYQSPIIKAYLLSHAHSGALPAGFYQMDLPTDACQAMLTAHHLQMLLPSACMHKLLPGKSMRMRFMIIWLFFCFQEYPESLANVSMCKAFGSATMHQPDLILVTKRV